MTDAEMWKAYEQWNATAPKVQAARSIWQAAYRQAQEDFLKVLEEKCLEPCDCMAVLAIKAQMK